jgi:vacuolar-type H+-ATPase subunit I/STV1
MTTRRTAAGGLLLLALGLSVGAAPAVAQDEEPVTRERMTEFARAHLQISEIRDEFHGEVARVHDEEGRTRAREQVEEKISAVLEEHEMTREEFDEITLLISLDGELRAMFDEILAELAEEGT